MTIEEKKLLSDILQCITSIDEHLEWKRVFSEYQSNKTKRRAVERELEITGEAVSKLLKINPAIQISYARQIVDLRNKVIHAYDNVNHTVIWNVIINHLPIKIGSGKAFNYVILNCRFDPLKYCLFILNLIETNTGQVVNACAV